MPHFDTRLRKNDLSSPRYERSRIWRASLSENDENAAALKIDARERAGRSPVSDDPVPEQLEANAVVLGCGLFPVEFGQYGRRRNLPLADTALIGMKLKEALEIVRTRNQGSRCVDEGSSLSAKAFDLRGDFVVATALGLSSETRMATNERNSGSKDRFIHAQRSEELFLHNFGKGAARDDFNNTRNGGVASEGVCVFRAGSGYQTLSR